MDMPEDGHLGTPTINMLGQRFGNWIVIARGANKGSHAQWHCICQCAARTQRLVDGKQLRSGRSTSCGCVARAAFASVPERRAVVRSDGTAYASMTEAAQALGASKSSIARACQSGAWSHGFRWAYADTPTAAAWITRNEREAAMRTPERIVLDLPVCQDTDVELAERFLCDVVGQGTVRLVTIGVSDGRAQGTFFDLSKPAGLKRLREHLRRYEHAEVNQYFTANVTGERITGKHGVAAEEDVTHIRMIVIDIDPEEEGGCRWPRRGRRSGRSRHRWRSMPRCRRGC